MLLGNAFQRTVGGLKVLCIRAVSVGMDTKEPTPEASRDLIRAAGETLELICRLRGVDIE